MRRGTIALLAVMALAAIRGLAQEKPLRLLPEVRVILMSSHYTIEEAAHLARLFGDGNFIEKSTIGKELIPAISRVLREESQAVESHTQV